MKGRRRGHIHGLAGLASIVLRHSYASRALALGEGLPSIGGLLGHVRVGTTAKYAHLIRDAERTAAARTSDSIGAQIVPERAETARGGGRWRCTGSPSPTAP